jgi:type IV secretory pathway TraG/TraD family ATPase VirD4
MESFWPEYLQAKYLKLKLFCRFGMNLFKSSRWFVRIFSKILFTIVRVFSLGFIQDKITITFWPISANYRTVNGKLLAWIFPSKILEIEAHFAILAWIYSSQASDLLGIITRYCLLLFVYFGLDLFRTRLP